MNNHKRKMFAPIIITILMIVYYGFYFCFLVHFLRNSIAVLFGVIPLVLSIMMIYTCIERIKEIKRGEEDDISKY